MKNNLLCKVSNDIFVWLIENFIKFKNEIQLYGFSKRVYFICNILSMRKRIVFCKKVFNQCYNTVTKIR